MVEMLLPPGAGSHPEIATVRALSERALQLDETWSAGAIHEAMIAVDGLPALLGGSPAPARAHFERAVAVANGESAFAYVTLATSCHNPPGTARSSSGC